MSGFPRFDDEAPSENKTKSFSVTNPYSEVDTDSQKPPKTYSIDEDSPASLKRTKPDAQTPPPLKEAPKRPGETPPPSFNNKKKGGLPSQLDPSISQDDEPNTVHGSKILFGKQEAPKTDNNPFDIDEVLTEAVKNKASDIHIRVNAPLMNRVDGDITPMRKWKGYIVEEEWVIKTLKYMMSDRQFNEFQENLENDLSHTVADVARFRVNAAWQRMTPAIVLRVIPEEIKTLQELKVPPILEKLTKKPQGLVLVTGPTGSGKSTTLAAMVDSINRTRTDHIMTIEDPIEFVHQDKKSLITQREVGTDTLSFAEGLKRVLRQDPDVILVGELRDPETIAVALTAAETGHLVFGTLHTQSAAKTINRIIDSFPSHAQNQVRTQLSDTLQAVISQVLLKKVGGGRIAAAEIMVRTAAIANQIREGEVAGLYSTMQTARQDGMETLDKALERLVNAGEVNLAEARKHATNPDELKGAQIDGYGNGW